MTPWDYYTKPRLPQDFLEKEKLIPPYSSHCHFSVNFLNAAEIIPITLYFKKIQKLQYLHVSIRQYF